MKKKLEKIAVREKTSMGALIRELAAAKLKEQEEKPNGYVLLELAKHAVKGTGPKDLAEHMDDYLYGDR